MHKCNGYWTAMHASRVVPQLAKLALSGTMLPPDVARTSSRLLAERWRCHTRQQGEMEGYRSSEG